MRNVLQGDLVNKVRLNIGEELLHHDLHRLNIMVGFQPTISHNTKKKRATPGYNRRNT
jgi:outer membrane protease